MSSLITKISIALIFSLMVLSCNNLKKGELAIIKYDNYGCFGSSSSTITLIKNNNILFAKLHSTDLNKIVAIGPADRQRFENIVLKLRALKEKEGCTNSVKYSVFTKEGSFRRNDNACQDVGIEYFIQEIFEKAN